MDTNNFPQEIQDKLREIANEFQQIVDVPLPKVSDWLSYNDALTEVKSAIASLEKLNVSDTSVQCIEEQPKDNKSFMAKLREIKIDAPADFSTNYRKYS